MSDPAAKRIKALDEENQLLRQEIETIRESSEISSKLVIKQFEATESLLQRLEEANALRHAILDAAQQMSIIALDLDGRVTFFSVGAERLLGCREAEAVGKMIFTDFIQEKELTLHCEEMSANIGRTVEGIQLFKEYAKRMDSKLREWTHVRRDGSFVPVNLSVTGLKGANGSITGYLAAAVDLTERKHFEAALAEARDAADMANQAKGRFLANMSHEIRTPMNAIIGLSHLALKTDLTAKQRDYLKKIHLSGANLLGIINDILDFSKIEAGKLDIEAVEFYLDEILDNLSHLIDHKIGEKGLELLFSVNKYVPQQLIGDPLRLGQVLLNLANNALKFTESGEIVITTALEKKTSDRVTLRFSVRDSGIGMTEEQMSRLFKAFSQADSMTTRKYGGTGLGLTISKQLIELMGGKIWVESKPGLGSTFAFTASFCRHKESKQRIPKIAMDLRGKKVLVVDDNAASREILEDMLSYMTFDVTAVSSGAVALEALDRAAGDKPFEIVLMDWKMPGLDGIETARRIRNDRELKTMPTIIMVTAYGREEVMFQAEEEGFDAFLMKPVNPSVLYDTIASVISGQIEGIAVRRAAEDAPQVAAGILGARILLADDNEINQQVALELLEDMGFEVIIANNGLEAVRTLTENSAGFDLLLMDIQMPVMDGYHATRIIRKELNLLDLPIVAMTAHAMTGEKEKSLAHGMNDHLTKPIDPKALFDALARWIKPKEVPAAAFPVAPAAMPHAAMGDEDDLPDALPSFDIKAALDRLNGKKKLLRKLLFKFHDAYADLIPRLREMFAAMNHEEAIRLAHTVKGGAGNLEAKDVFEAARLLEDAWQVGRMDEIPALIAGLEASLIPALAAIATLSKAKPEKIVSANSPLDGQAVAGMLRELDGLLAINCLDARKVFPQARRALAGRAVDHYLSDMETAMDQLDFVAAQKSLRSLSRDLGLAGAPAR